MLSMLPAITYPAQEAMVTEIDASDIFNPITLSNHVLISTVLAVLLGHLSAP